MKPILITGIGVRVYGKSDRKMTSFTECCWSAGSHCVKCGNMRTTASTEGLASDVSHASGCDLTVPAR